MPETSCWTNSARTYVKENAEKEKRNHIKKKSDWLNPGSIGIQMHHPEKKEKNIPIKRPRIPDFCTSHQHN